MDSRISFIPSSDRFEQIVNGYYRGGGWDVEVYDREGEEWIHIRHIMRGMVYDGPNDRVIVERMMVASEL